MNLLMIGFSLSEYWETTVSVFIIAFFFFLFVNIEKNLGTCLCFKKYVGDICARVSPFASLYAAVLLALLFFPFALFCYIFSF